MLSGLHHVRVACPAGARTSRLELLAPISPA